MGDGHKGIIGVFDERWCSFDIANAVDEPIHFDLEDASHLAEAVEPRTGRAAAQDVIDKGRVERPRRMS